ncbi:MAG: Uncharacterized protein Greene041662_274 [Candidatus Peregrinibacteria bacterium Greene0416_62]|nr:MAG: Uncharacterized protein Greene041662_274 [Candidatus Peregrinibacteria bacterium Greene0416_62]TSC98980.1 MAG: Uncharacterized protein Greene101449_763 [Candidatus Peregrinibacteria bacterium Greene1014_49]
MHTSIAIDKITRDRAALRAKNERMPLAMVVRVLLTDYAEGRLSIGTHMQREVTAKSIPVDKATQKRMDSVVAQWRGRLPA